MAELTRNRQEQVAVARPQEKAPNVQQAEITPELKSFMNLINVYESTRQNVVATAQMIPQPAPKVIDLENISKFYGAGGSGDDDQPYFSISLPPNSTTKLFDISCPIEKNRCVFDHSTTDPFHRSKNPPMSLFSGVCVEHFVSAIGIAQTIEMVSYFDDKCGEIKKPRSLFKAVSMNGEKFAFEPNEAIIPDISRQPENYSMTSLITMNLCNVENVRAAGAKLTKQFMNFLKSLQSSTVQRVDICKTIQGGGCNAKQFKNIAGMMATVGSRFVEAPPVSQYEVDLFGIVFCTYLQMCIDTYNASLSDFLPIQIPERYNGFNLFKRLLPGMMIKTRNSFVPIEPNVEFGGSGLLAIRRICNGDPLVIELDTDWTNKDIFEMQTAISNPNAVCEVKKPPSYNFSNDNSILSTFGKRTYQLEQIPTAIASIKKCSAIGNNYINF